MSEDKTYSAYFDNAATTFPKPQIVYEFMNEFYRANGGNAGRGNSTQSLSSGFLIQDTREKIQELFHAPSKQVVFTSGATMSLNIIIQGLIKEGTRNIYISPFEHNAVTRTLHEFEKEKQISVFELNLDRNLNYDFEKIRYAFENKKPDLVIISHASNVFGLVSPVEKIFALAKKYGAVTLTDMAQTAGLIDLNLEQEIFDFAVFAGHKTLYGPTGIGGFVMKKNLNLKSIYFGGTGFESAKQEMPSSLPERFEAGTLNILGIAGLNASVKWILKTGIKNIYAKEIENREKLLKIFSKYEFVKIAGNKSENHYTGIVSVLLDGIPSDTADQIFSKQGISVRTGLQCAPSAHKTLGTFPAGTIRFSPSYFTTEEDFEELENCFNYIEENL